MLATAKQSLYHSGSTSVSHGCGVGSIALASVLLAAEMDRLRLLCLLVVVCRSSVEFGNSRVATSEDSSLEVDDGAAMLRAVDRQRDSVCRRCG